MLKQHLHHHVVPSLSVASPTIEYPWRSCAWLDAPKPLDYRRYLCGVVQRGPRHHLWRVLQGRAQLDRHLYSNCQQPIVIKQLEPATLITKPLIRLSAIEPVVGLIALRFFY